MGVSHTWSGSLCMVDAGMPMGPVDTRGLASGAAPVSPPGLVERVVADATREGTPPDAGAMTTALDPEMLVAAAARAGLKEDAATSDSWDPSVVMLLLETC